MAIEKKSLIRTLETTKKANVASSTPSVEAHKKMNKYSPKTLYTKSLKSHAKSLKSTKVAAKLAAKKMEW